MACTPRLSVRAEPELVDAARRNLELPADASPSEVTRYALATVAGMERPESVAYVSSAPKVHWRTRLQMRPA